jgi:hypothetical protein
VPVTPDAPDRTAPPPLVVAAALTAVEALVLAGLGVLELANLHTVRVTMGVTTAAFFLGAAAALAWCAWALWSVRRWARGPVVMAQLIVLGLAWNLWAGSTKPVSAALAVVGLVVIAGLLHPASTRVLESDPV